MSTAVTATKVTPIAATPMDMVSAALDKGLTGEDLQRMMDLSERFEANEARKAYNQAMTEFKKDPPRISKDRTVSYSGTKYDHASHSQVNEVIGAALAKFDISHRFEVAQDSGKVTVSCVLTHKLGHSERVSMTSAPDDSGKKNAIQAIGSAVTYLERYTLQAATGIASHDMGDDDGGAPVEYISESQVADLDALVSEVGADKAKMLAYFKVSSLSEVPLPRYKDVVAMLNAKRAK